MHVSVCDFVAGCVGGSLGVIVGQPMDTIKTWQQRSNTTIAKTTMTLLKSKHGHRAFFRGMAFPIMTTGVVNSLMFGVYGNQLRDFQRKIRDRDERRAALPLHVFLAGTYAGFIQSFVASPVELIKIRMQCGMTYRNSWHCLQTIYKLEGVRGYFRGFFATVCRDVFPYGIYMLSYVLLLGFAANLEYVRKERWNNRANKVSITNNKLEFCITTISGCVAGLMSWGFVIPIDVIKTMQQAEADPKKVKGIIGTGRELIKVSGSLIGLDNLVIIGNISHSIGTGTPQPVPWQCDAANSFVARECSHVCGLRVHYGEMQETHQSDCCLKWIYDELGIVEQQKTPCVIDLHFTSLYLF